MGAQKNTDEPFLKAFQECCTLAAARMVQPWLHSDAVYKLLSYHGSFEASKKVIWNFVQEVTLLPTTGHLSISFRIMRI